MINAFNIIEAEIKEENSYPHIHLECHGNNDGICLTNKTRLTWHNLASLTTNINGLCKNNLVVSMALCYGGHFNVTLIENLNASKVSRAPAVAIVGPEKVISYGQLQDGFAYFFDTFLTTRNLYEAVKSLNIHSKYEGKYIYHSCEGMYKSLAEYFLKSTLQESMMTRNKFNERMNRIIKSYRLQTGRSINKKQIGLLRNRMLEKDTYLGILEEMRNTYYWIDQFPENEKRFGKYDITNWEEMTKHLK